MPVRIPALATAVFAGMYFLPWLLDDPMTGLGWSLLAYFWFLFAWIFALAYNLFFAFKKWKAKDNGIVRELCSFFFILLSYAVLTYFSSKGYLLTV